MGHHAGTADAEAELGRVLALLVGTRGRWRKTAARKPSTTSCAAERC